MDRGCTVKNFCLIVLKLMDVKTLVAGVIPVVFGSVYSFYRYGTVNSVDIIILILGILLLQSSTNMINDVYDHKRGADGKERSDEKVLASGEVSVKLVKRIIMSFLFIDIGIALYYSITRHFGILLVAVSAVIIMIGYSAGKKPISYTPFGELVAGSTMGFGIMSTVIFIHSSRVSIETLLVALPTSVFIGTILLTNNMSDWNEDQRVGRKTLPILIGIHKAEVLWKSSVLGLLVITGLLCSVRLLSNNEPDISLIGDTV
jgi:1,4-dihydroxy-2-naphthoate polyprenyltransferase